MIRALLTTLVLATNSLSALAGILLINKGRN